MRPRSDYEVFESSSTKNRRLLREEELILEVTETLAEALHREGITKAELAARLGKSRAFVSQILAGGRNLTLRTVADVADALGCRIKTRACKAGAEGALFSALDQMDLENWGREGGHSPWDGRVVKGDFSKAGSASGAAA